MMQIGLIYINKTVIANLSNKFEIISDLINMFVLYQNHVEYKLERKNVCV